MAYAEVMALPLKTFWLLSGNIDRIQARDDLRAVSIALAGQSTPEAVTEYRQRLVVEAGMIVKLGRSTVSGDEREEREKRDEAGFLELKAMAKQWQ